MKDNLEFKSFKKEKRIFTYRFIVLGILFFILFTISIGRLIFLQIYQHEHYKELSWHNRIKKIPIIPTRGAIYDRQGIVLAKNRAKLNLLINREEVVDPKRTVENLSRVIPIDQQEIDKFNEKIESSNDNYLLIKEDLTQDEAALFSVNSHNFPEITLQGKLTRTYPKGEEFAHIVGYVKRVLPNLTAQSNFIGAMGIEKSYDNFLRGHVGTKYLERNAKGEYIQTLFSTKSKPGNDLYLTIDARLQKVAHEALKGMKGAILVINPQNGEILAMVSQPSFDPNIFVLERVNEIRELFKNPSKPLFNRALKGLYSPASTIKPFIGLKGLDDEIIDMEDRIYDQGWYKIKGSSRVFRDWANHGWVDLHKAIIVSCDTFFYHLSYIMGIDRISEMLAMFGWGELTSIDLIGEERGFIPSPLWKMQKTGNPWYEGDTVLMGIGQGYLQTTPLQLVKATATLALHGKQHVPHLVYKIKDPIDNRTIYYKEKELLQVELKNEQHYQNIIEAMSKVHTSGTGHRFGKVTYSLASKTGTAQIKRDNSKKKEQNRSHNEFDLNSLFIAFAPLEKPTITIVVIVEDSSYLAPIIARKVFDSYFDII